MAESRSGAILASVAQFGRKARWWQGLGPQHPAQVLALAFVGAIGLGTLLLMLPASVAGEGTGGAPFVAALFTATSAVCVTGLVVVDTATYWSGFGQTVVIVLIQLGGLGIMTAASLIAILLARRLGLRTRFIVSASVRAVGIGEVRKLVIGVARLTFTVEAAITLALTARLVLGYGADLGQALAWGGFTAVSAFNNAGFALWSDNLESFGGDPWMLLPVCAAVIIGGLGFPVLFEIRRHLHLPRRWSMHTSLVLIGTGVLLLGGTAAVSALEWTNPDTLGPMPAGQKVLAGFVAATMTRTAGFNAVDIGAMTTQSLFTQDLLMFVGGGPAGTAGGVKITTFAVLFFIIFTELRGETAVNILGRRLSRSVHREAITIALLSIAVVVTGTWLLLVLTTFTLDQILFEVISAFGTVGLSTGITAHLPTAAQVVLVLTMFIGRLGPLTVGTALAMRDRRARFELPKERPLVG